MQVWNNMWMSKWQNCHFWVICAFKNIILAYIDVLCIPSDNLISLFLCLQMSRATCCEMQRQRCCSVLVWRSHWRELMQLRCSRWGALRILVHPLSLPHLFMWHFRTISQTTIDLSTDMWPNWISQRSVSLTGVFSRLTLLLTGEVFLYNSRNLSEPQHNESYSRECRRESALQAALLPQDHGAQAKQGTLIRSPIQGCVGLYWWGCCVRFDSLT